MVIHEWAQTAQRLIDSLLTPPVSINSRMNQQDAENAIRRYATRIGISPSDATAACSWGLNNGNCTLTAIREGKKRCDRLKAGRERFNPLPPSAA